MKTICLTVALDEIVNVDEIEGLINAIKLMKKVSNVTANEFSGTDRMEAWSFKQNWLNKFATNMLDAVMNEKVNA